MGKKSASPPPIPSDKVAVLLRWNDTGVSTNYRAALPKQVGPFPADAVVWVSASGESTVKEDAGTLGVLVRILKDGNVVASDSDTTTAPESTNCSASASFVFYLPAGDKVIILGETIPKKRGTVNNSDAWVRLDIIALAAVMCSPQP